MLSLNSLMTLAAWAIGLLGVGGAIAAAAAAIILGPTVVIAIVQPILARILSCTRCVVAAVFVLAMVGFYWLGHHQAAKECRADQLEAQLRNEKFDTAQALKAQADEKQRADDIEREARAQHDQDQAYIERLKAKPACALDDSDLDAGRLRIAPRSGGAKPARNAK
ncbi:hypothetical protein [Nitrobacter sp.]|uniref:hypothetical protein n=1 Tax=Nitrobacter sp. TaxID=29420 RepID=UPI003F64C1ED